MRFTADQALHPADGPEDRLLTERCILFGAAGPPMLPEPYNNNYEIVQSRGMVGIAVEMNHDTRLIALDGSPHLPPQIHQWSGDSRGHWEGDTLIVDSTNFKFNNQSRFGVGYLEGMTDENLRVVERFRRVDPSTIIYQATIDDPTVYTKPWTVEISMAKRNDRIFEYACHEGNYAMCDMLSGARADEKRAAAHEQMKQSTNRILTTHVGSLSRPADLVALYREQAPPEKLDPQLTSAVVEVVRHQIEARIDIVNDGEFGKPVFDEVDYGAWASYIHQRISGSEMRELPADFNFGTSVMAGSKDRADFAEFYQSDEAGIGFRRRPLRYPMNVGPIRYTGHALVQRDIRNLKAALAGQKVEDAFLTAAVTGVSIIPGEYYKNPEEQGAAIAEAMREEYRAITDAGINVQLDDPIIVNVYEWQYSISGDMAAFRKWAESHVELVNHALEGIPKTKSATTSAGEVGKVHIVPTSRCAR